MKRAEASFSVVTVVREETPVIRRFCEHYLALGAERIFLYVDGEASGARAAMELMGPAASRVDLSEMLEEDWIARFGYPERVLDRKQQKIFPEAHARCESGWTFFADADEFLLARQPIAEMLEQVDPGIPSFRLMPAEAVWGPGDNPNVPFGSTHFRRPFRRRRIWHAQKRFLYDRHHGLFRNNVLGHQEGKHFLRTDVRPDSIEPHWSRIGGSIISPEFPFGMDGCVNEVLHFDAISLERWMEKMRRRHGGETTTGGHPMRKRQAREVAALHDPETGHVDRDRAERMFRASYGVDRLRRAVQEAQGTMFRANPFG